jgi:putative nucleotidyltransferase with HDIG domain
MTSGRILLVDNVDHISRQLSDEIKRLNRPWIVKSVETATPALNELESEAYDVVVAELALPGETGVDLLKKVADAYPGAIRIALSSASDRQMILQTAGVAHRFVAKPTNGSTLMGLLDTSINLREMFGNPELHARVAKIGSLPSPPEVYDRLMAELKIDECSIRGIADLIAQDVAITAKILQMINSAYFGLPSRVSSVLQAVNLLGLETVKSLVLAVGVFGEFRAPEAKFRGLTVESLYRHSVTVGANSQRIAMKLGLPRYMCDDSLMAGMLHDIGKLILMSHFPEELTESIEMAMSKSWPLEKAQERVMGLTHAEIGAHLLSLWGLSDQILEAVALHSVPSRMPCPIKSVLTAVHIANGIETETLHETVPVLGCHLDEAYLKTLNVIDLLGDFRVICEAISEN